MSKIDKTSIDNFQSINIEKLSRKEDLGLKNFDEIIPQFSELKLMLDDLIKIEAENSNIPTALANQVNGFINTLNSFAKQFMAYNLDNDARGNFSQRTNLIQSFQKYYNDAFTGTNNNNFLNVFNAIKNYSIKGIQTETQEYERLKKQLIKDQSDVDSLLNALRAKATEKTVSDYARIFEEQSKKHSNVEFKKEFPFIFFGSSQTWLTIGVLLLIVFFIIIYYSREYFPIEIIQKKLIEKEAIETVRISYTNLVTRIIILSINIYLITFAFRQFSINKHLSTTNKHRQNALNSYQLFVDSMKGDNENPTLRHALMLEVAKAIYGQEKSGYISDKYNSNAYSPTILEFTKLLDGK